MTRKPAFLFLSLAATAICLIASPSAFANSTVDLGFSCSPGTGTTTGNAALCAGATETHPNSTQALVNWAQGQFSIKPASGHWLWDANSGDVGGAIAHGDPSITSGANHGSQTSSISITDGGGWFDFKGIDIAGASSWTIKGYLGNVLKYTIACSSNCGDLGHYLTINGKLVAVNDVVITLTSPCGGVDYLDDPLIAAAPEPSGLLLLGTGLLALGFLVRRKLIA